MSPSVEAFDEAKYKALMDGLSAKEEYYQDVLTATDYLRLESDYYLSGALSYTSLLKGSAIAERIQYGTSKLCDEQPSGYPVLRLNELGDCFIETPQKYCHNLTEAEFEELQLKKNDVLVIRTNGNPDLVGRAAIVMEDTPFAFASYIFRVIPNSKMNSATLVLFLNCKYGRQEINKNSMKGNQTNFSPAKFRDISVPEFGLALQTELEAVLQRAYSLRIHGQQLYSIAEGILSESIAATEKTTKPPVVAIKLESESFAETGRLDAEYYQPKYDSIVRSLGTEDTVRSLCNLYDNSFTPQKESTYRYIELANVGMNGEISDVKLISGGDLPSRARRKVVAGQVIVSSVEGSLPSCALVDDEFDGALCSTGFYVFDSNAINSETLLVLFKSESIQALMKQRCSGTILSAISKEELLSMPFPMINETVQRRIAERVQESFALRRKSKELLEYAKQAVEMAIEQGEASALDWLKERVDQ